MSRSVPVNIGDRNFSSKIEARKNYTAILNKVQLNEPLDGFNKSDIDDLFHCHPDYKRKSGMGDYHIEVRVTESGTKAFHVVGEDGRGESFSITSCISGQSKTPWEKLNRAARLAIMATKLSYKQDYFKVYGIDDKAPSELTGEMYPWMILVVDHVSTSGAGTFKSILEGFIKSESLNEGDIYYSNDGEFIDNELKERWAKYHDEKVATPGSLRVISKIEHQCLTNQNPGKR